MPEDKPKFTTIRVSRETHEIILAGTEAESARIGYPVAMEWFVRRAVEEKEARDAKKTTAPDILRALKDMVSLAIPGQNWTDDISAPVLEQARAIIRRAEGRE